MTTGSNTLNEGLDLVVEGDAVRLTESAMLHRLAAAYGTKYGEHWRFTVRDDGAFIGAGGAALVYRLTPSVAFGKGTYSQTRWRFSCPP